MHISKYAGPLAAALLALAAGTSRQSTAVAQAEPAWMSDYAAAQAAARRSGKPVFLVFR
jgi:hypothetical protein